MSKYYKNPISVTYINAPNLLMKLGTPAVRINQKHFLMADYVIYVRAHAYVHIVY